MRYFLDSDIIIEFLRKQPERLVRRLDRLSDDEAGMSAVVFSELLFGVRLSARPGSNRKALDQFLEGLLVMDYDQNAAEHYADIRLHLQTKGALIGPMDMLIAAHARSLGLTLVTHNVREFKRVPGLKVEIW